MKTTPTLTSEWREWIATNLERNCTHLSIVDAMVRQNFDPGFANAVVELAAHGALAVPSGNGSATHVVPAQNYHPEGSRVTVANCIQTFDRPVRVAMRLEKPDVILFDGVLSDEECATLIERSEAKLLRSTTVDPKTGAPIFEERRSSVGTFFQLNEDPFIAGLDRRIAELMNWPVENGEGIQILKYLVGGEYKPHYDYFPPDDPGSAVHMQQGGQRVASLVMYLNDVEDGGETIFPEIGLNVCPKRGSAVYFAYTNSRGQIDPKTYHGGAPVRRGEKWIATKWMRERAYG